MAAIEFPTLALDLPSPSAAEITSQAERQRAWEEQEAEKAEQAALMYDNDEEEDGLVGPSSKYGGGEKAADADMELDEVAD